jgi:pimeloyl-ACP methyl ester carboxylesterase
VLCIHGLGATKASFFDMAAALTAGGYRVHALDLPGFGSSSKPTLGAYDARWFAETILGVMDQLGIERARLVGNSMGGRAAIEVALRRPERVDGLACCVPPSPGSAGPAPHRPPAAAEAGCCPIASRVPWSPGSSGACSPTATVSTRASPTSWSTSSSATTRRRALAWPSWPRRATSTSTALRPRRLLPAPGRPGAARALRLGYGGSASSPPGSSATSPSGCPPPSRSCSTSAATSLRSSAGPGRRAGPALLRPGRRAGGRGVEAPARGIAPVLDSAAMSEARPAAADPRRNGPLDRRRPTWRTRGRALDGGRRRGRPGRSRPLAGGPRRAGAGQAGHEPHPGRRPRRTRPRLHPRQPARPVAAGQPLVPRRGARPGNVPTRGRCCSSATTRRQPHAGHRRLHAGLLGLLRRRATLLPAGPQPGALHARLGFLRRFGTGGASPRTRARPQGRRRAARVSRR